MKPMQSINRVMLHSRAAETIAQFIRQNALEPGDKLPSERILAQQLGIGRNSLREALRTLEADGVIEVRNGLGVYVREPHEYAISLKANARRIDLLELLDTRTALEKHAVELCVKNAADEELARARPCLVKMREIASQGGEMHEADAAFHRAIYRAAHNQTLGDLLMQIDETATACWGQFTGHRELFVATLPAHEQLYEALCARALKRALAAAMDILHIDADFIAAAMPKNRAGNPASLG